MAGEAARSRTSGRRYPTKSEAARRRSAQTTQPHNPPPELHDTSHHSLTNAMSVDLNWETLTSGPDGDALAERIRTFIHDKFQTVPLPRFIRSVNVHGFDFGKIPPELELKDMTDPLPDFYEHELDDDESEDDEDHDDEGDEQQQDALSAAAAVAAAAAAASTQGGGRKSRPPGGLRTTGLRGEFDMGSPFLGTSTPGILGGPGRNYFQGHLGTGTHTPLAAVAGAQPRGNGGWMGGGSGTLSPALAYYDDDYDGNDAAAHGFGAGGYHQHHGRHPSQSSVLSSVDNFLEHPDHPAAQALREKSSVSTLAPTSVSTSRPPTRDAAHFSESAIIDDDDGDGTRNGNGQRGNAASATAEAQAQGEEPQRARPRREPRVEDVQAVFRIRYAGDVRLNLTAEILLDYPMPSFVGIPLKLNITGLSFDGVGVLAKIRKRVHFCFLSPEDAIAAIGPDTDEDEGDNGNANGSASAAAAAVPRGPGGSAEGKQQQQGPQQHKGRVGGLLQEIRVESEIGERDGGKQSLKNVGKVERFVLEQVRRIFEEEFVYPSFWTFLV